jgi:hypothetical protein
MILRMRLAIQRFKNSKIQGFPAGAPYTRNTPVYPVRGMILRMRLAIQRFKNSKIQGFPAGMSRVSMNRFMPRTVHNREQPCFPLYFITKHFPNCVNLRNPAP